MAKKRDPIGGLIVVTIDGYSGEGPELVGFDLTATGIKVTLRGALALALQISDTSKSSYINAKVT